LVYSDKDYPTTPLTQVCCENNEDTTNCGDVKENAGEWNEKVISAGPLGGSGTDWTCSSDYATTAYSLAMCPFKRSACGPVQKINFYDPGDDGAVHI